MTYEWKKVNDPKSFIVPLLLVPMGPITEALLENDPPSALLIRAERIECDEGVCVICGFHHQNWEPLQ